MTTQDVSLIVAKANGLISKAKELCASIELEIHNGDALSYPTNGSNKFSSDVVSGLKQLVTDLEESKSDLYNEIKSN